jgi:anti-sigma regulatory factor (Ser/Thr protein kinase)
MSIEERTEEAACRGDDKPEDSHVGMFVGVFQELGDEVYDERSQDGKLIGHEIQNRSEDVAT